MTFVQQDAITAEQEKGIAMAYKAGVYPLSATVNDAPYFSYIFMVDDTIQGVSEKPEGFDGSEMELYLLQLIEKHLHDQPRTYTED